MLPAAACQHLYAFTRPETDPTGGQTVGGERDPHGSALTGATQGRIDLKRAMRDWGEVYYAPLDVTALDPPDVCDRCRAAIAPEDALDYLEADDGSVSIVHECCPAAA